MSCARIRPAELSLPVEGGAWLKQSQHQDQHQDQHYNTSPRQSGVQDDQQSTIQHSEPREQTFVYVNTSSSCSDLTSPLTPTFSAHGSSHLRYASSTSSLDLQTTTSSTCSDTPVSPAPPVLPSHNATTTSNAKRPLPDVQEDPLEREDDEPTMTRLTDDQIDSLYDCLCDSPCIHQSSDMVRSADWTCSTDNDLGCFDYDMGFLSDAETDPTLQATRTRSGTDSPIVGLTTRLGSRFPTLNRWRSTRRRNRAFTAASEPSFDLPPPLSRATSTSRSSSLSAPSQKFFDRSNEPPMPQTPAMSLYGFESTESIPIPNVVALDIDRANVCKSIEREREQARTPLLPPLLTEAPSVSSQNQSQAPSPLQSPTVAPQLSLDFNSPVSYATPPLSTKASLSSFRPPLLTSLSTPVVATSEVLVTIPNLLEQHDAWSDRLGHANFTILPRPYLPEAADLETMRTLRADWDLARINYTKHIVRTGEHYGITSKTYALTEAKWAETEREWKAVHDDLLDRVAASNPGKEALLQWDRLQDDTPTAVPKMLDAEGKFPDLGDEDIVGPMVRDAVMIREPGLDAEYGSKKFWKNLAGKVGLRK
ncbi:hypothetical protein VP1G_09093 [Cytospora mali]|uniref:Only prolin and serin are matching in the corresponding protein n=1 Tax=Cytospora mali TaxID=578113 RepID=A0A194VD76_CYTMA|nr:hypothetical protein VP1G_09093 [Valsa mali var. pyri (nom. inval.)]